MCTVCLSLPLLAPAPVLVQSPQVKDLIERMLHPDPLQRATLSRVRKHPWAAPVVAAVYKSISEPKDCSLLISDDPTKDLYEGALRKVCADKGPWGEALLSMSNSPPSLCFSSVYTRTCSCARGTPLSVVPVAAATAAAAETVGAGHHSSTA